jgi:hypothetical protein
MKITVCAAVLLGLAGLLAAGPLPGLTGSWIADDGATYYVRQTDDVVWWLGISGDNGRSFTNVFHGKIIYPRIVGDWADLPLGGTMNFGQLTLQLVAVGTPNGFGDVQFQKESATGSFSANHWRRGAIGRPPGESDNPVVPDGVFGRGPNDLTGIWGADDGATYYVRQIGETVWWAGLSADGGRSFTNVFYGKIRTTFSSLEISGSWADVPRGRSAQSGSLALESSLIGPPSGDTGSRLVKRSQTGGFGGSLWRRLSGL